MKEIYNNFKGAKWFKPDLDVILIGLGNIGSWVGINLARQGYNIYCFDDDIYEPHNNGSQFAGKSDIDKRKDQVFKEMSENYADNYNIELLGLYTKDSMTGNVVICGLDSIEARRIAFENWKEYQMSKTKEHRIKNPKEINIFIDGRLTIEEGCVLTLNSSSDIKKYESTLYEKSEIPEQPCSFRQSTHSGMMIASIMTGCLLNEIANKEYGFELRQVPYCTYFDMININISCSEN